MKCVRRRKCLCCGELFRADPRNRRHQRHCGKAACRKASKAASQRRWLAKAENRDYFQGAINVARVQAWRAAHPGYWRRARAGTAPALQEDSSTQGIETHSDSPTPFQHSRCAFLTRKPAALRRVSSAAAKAAGLVQTQQYAKRWAGCRRRGQNSDLPFSRSMEMEADALGMEIAVRVSYKLEAVA